MNHPVPQEEGFQPLPLKRAEHEPVHSRDNPFHSDKGQDLWLLTLSDLLLLLVIFFLVLFGLTLQQLPEETLSAKSQAASPAKSEETLSAKSQAASPAKSEETLPAKSQAASPPKSEETPAATRSANVLDSASKEILASLEKELRNLSDEEGNDGVSVTRRADHLVLTFPERIVFDPGRAEIKPFVQPVLDKVASLASSYPQLLVEVQGHTDDRPINTQRYPSNWELSVHRATQVARALIGLGLDPGQVMVKGFGEYRALYPNDTDSNRHKNRRVEIQFFLTPPA